MTHEPALARRLPSVRVAQWVTVAILVASSEAVSWSGHVGASYGVDGVALLAFLGFRWLRQSSRRHSPMPGRAAGEKIGPV
jgi:hypothetical protein